MDALLFAFICCLLIEAGGRMQLLALAFATRWPRHFSAIFWGIALAAIANAAISGAAGAYIAPLLTANARSLFLALALASASLSLFARIKAPDPLTGWRIGPFLTALLGMFILGFADSSQFMVLAFTVRTADPVLAAAGGAAGVILACLPVLVFRTGFFTAMPLRAIRFGAGTLFLISGALLALSAFGRL